MVVGADSFYVPLSRLSYCLMLAIINDECRLIDEMQQKMI